MDEEYRRALDARRPIVELVRSRRPRDRWGISRSWREWLCPPPSPGSLELPGLRRMSSIVQVDTADAPRRVRPRWRQPGEVRMLGDADPGDVVEVAVGFDVVLFNVSAFIWSRTAALLRRCDAAGREDLSTRLVTLDAKTPCVLVRPAPWSV